MIDMTESDLNYDLYFKYQDYFPSESNRTLQHDGDWEYAYQTLLDQYQYQVDNEIYRHYPLVRSEAIASNQSYRRKALSYLQYDIDDNGIPELFVWTTVQAGIYTYHENELIPLYIGGFENQQATHLAPNGELIVYAKTGADQYSLTKYHYNSEKTTFEPITTLHYDILTSDHHRPFYFANTPNKWLSATEAQLLFGYPVDYGPYLANSIKPNALEGIERTILIQE